MLCTSNLLELPFAPVVILSFNLDVNSSQVFSLSYIKIWLRRSHDDIHSCGQFIWSGGFDQDQMVCMSTAQITLLTKLKIQTGRSKLV